MSFNAKIYKAQWMREHRAKRHRRALISQGKCPISEILLTSKYHDPNCPCGVRLNYILVTETIIEVKPIEHTQDLPNTTTHSL